MTVWVPRAGGRPNTLRSPPLRQQFYMTWHLWGSIAIRSEMAEIQDCACCRRPTAGLYQLQLGRCTASDPPTPPWRPRRLSQAQRSSLKGSKTANWRSTRVKAPPKQGTDATVSPPTRRPATPYHTPELPMDTPECLWTYIGGVSLSHQAGTAHRWIVGYRL